MNALAGCWSSHTTTATGTLMLNIFASVAQFERDQMLVRQRIGIEAAKAKQ